MDEPARETMGHSSGDAELDDEDFHIVLSETLEEWVSPEDEEAFEEL